MSHDPAIDPRDDATTAPDARHAADTAEATRARVNQAIDKASAKLVAAASSGAHITKAVLTARKAGGKAGQVEYLIITMEDVMVSNFQTGGNSGNSSIPVDSFALNYTKIKYEYKPQKADGSLEGAIMAQYDRALNKAT